MPQEMLVATAEGRRVSLIRLVQSEDRESKLRLAGVPDAFLTAIADSDSDFCRESGIRFPETTYDYYNMTPYVYRRYGSGEVIPVCSAEGDPFYDCIIDPQGQVRFHENYLEHGGCLLGKTFSHMMFKIAIDFWELADDLANEQIARILVEAGYRQGNDLIAALMKADRSSAKKANDWSNANAAQFTD